VDQIWTKHSISRTVWQVASLRTYRLRSEPSRDTPMANVQHESAATGPAATVPSDVDSTG
jgi:hypothetical protein